MHLSVIFSCLFRMADHTQGCQMVYFQTKNTTLRKFIGLENICIFYGIGNIL
jgi:hypothetical protein